MRHASRSAKRPQTAFGRCLGFGMGEFGSSCASSGLKGGTIGAMRLVAMLGGPGEATYAPHPRKIGHVRPKRRRDPSCRPNGAPGRSPLAEALSFDPPHNLGPWRRAVSPFSSPRSPSVRFLHISQLRCPLPLFWPSARLAALGLDASSSELVVTAPRLRAGRLALS